MIDKTTLLIPFIKAHKSLVMYHVLKNRDDTKPLYGETLLRMLNAPVKPLTPRFQVQHANRIIVAILEYDIRRYWPWEKVIKPYLPPVPPVKISILKQRYASSLFDDYYSKSVYETQRYGFKDGYVNTKSDARITQTPQTQNFMHFSADSKERFCQEANFLLPNSVYDEVIVREMKRDRSNDYQ